MTLHITHVIKRDGQIQEFKKEKLDHWAQWASNELGIDWEDVSKSAFLRCENYCKTSDLQNAMIDACIDKESTAHQFHAIHHRCILISSPFREPQCDCAALLLTG